MLVHTAAVWEWDTYSLCKDGVDDTVDGAMKPKQPIVHLCHTTGRRVCKPPVQEWRCAVMQRGCVPLLDSRLADGTLVPVS